MNRAAALALSVGLVALASLAGVASADDERSDLERQLAAQRQFVLSQQPPPNQLLTADDNFLDQARRFVAVGLRKQDLGAYVDYYQAARTQQSSALSEVAVAGTLLRAGALAAAREHLAQSAAKMRLGRLYDEAASEIWEGNLAAAQQIEHAAGAFAADSVGLAGKLAERSGIPGVSAVGVVLQGEADALNFWLDWSFRDLTTAVANDVKSTIKGKVVDFVGERLAERYGKQAAGQLSVGVGVTDVAIDMVQLVLDMKKAIGPSAELTALIKTELAKTPGFVVAEGGQTVAGLPAIKVQVPAAAPTPPPVPAGTPSPSPASPAPVATPAATQIPTAKPAQAGVGCEGDAAATGVFGYVRWGSTPVAGAPVEAATSGQIKGAAVSDPSGYFKIVCLQPGRYFVSAAAVPALGLFPRGGRGLGDQDYTIVLAGQMSQVRSYDFTSGRGADAIQLALRDGGAVVYSPPFNLTWPAVSNADYYCIRLLDASNPSDSRNATSGTCGGEAGTAQVGTASYTFGGAEGHIYYTNYLAAYESIFQIASFRAPAIAVPGVSPRSGGYGTRFEINLTGFSPATVAFSYQVAYPNGQVDKGTSAPNPNHPKGVLHLAWTAALPEPPGTYQVSATDGLGTTRSVAFTVTP